MKYSTIIIASILTLLLGGCAKVSTQNNQSAEKTNEATETMNTKYKFPGKLSDEQIKDKKAVIKTSKGTIEVELFADKAPLTVSNFIYLVNEKFYDGLTFHRVEPGFVIQGGDPSGNGTGGPGYSFEDEKVMDEYTDGTLAMANSGPDSNGSQFFICLGDQSKSLTKSYNLFGRVVSGKDVTTKIKVGDKINSIEIKDK